MRKAKRGGEKLLPPSTDGLLLRENQPARAIVRFAADIRSHRQKFLWQDRIPLGTVGLLEAWTVNTVAKVHKRLVTNLTKDTTAAPAA
ncbi:hypothetical protein [Microbacterium sp. LWH13-1.2]|uniref:hypothetical protein n=1 Tax=Microbacterium sp. LWH13-1.2 TaxID=3135260 RepID=UPI0031386E14